MEEKSVEEGGNGNRKTHFGKVKKYFKEYCVSTSIHGFRYFGEKRTLFEKLWWLLIFIICLSACIFTIFLVYKKWENSPVIVTFATKPIPIYEIPHPAITVCSEYKINLKKFNLTETLERKRHNETLTDKEEKFLNYAASLCTYNDKYVTYKNRSLNKEFFEIMEEITPTFLPLNCQRFGEPYSCERLFTPIITDVGFCYSYNILDREDLFTEKMIHFKKFQKTKPAKWNIETGYNNSDLDDIISYPNRALLSGARYAFKFEIKTTADEMDKSCTESMDGYTVSVHSPMRLPRPSQQFFRIPLDFAVVASIKPTRITTSDRVRNFDPQVRECYFLSERQLKYFKIYSQENCKMECLAIHTFRQCRCVDFYMPRENGTRICDANDYECLYNSEYNHQAYILTNKLNIKYVSDTNWTECDCKPLCTDVSYDISISQTKWKWNKDVINLQNFDNGNQTELIDDPEKYFISRVTLYFHNSEFIGSQRNELYGPTDFLANFGGLLGLFTGFSFLSFMEIIYFLTLRIICNTRLYQDWSGR